MKRKRERKKEGSSDVCYVISIFNIKWQYDRNETFYEAVGIESLELKQEAPSSNLGIKLHHFHRVLPN